MTDRKQAKQSQNPRKNTSAKDQSGEAARQPSKAIGPRKLKSESKIEKVLSLLLRSDGATVDELVAVTGWQPHTTRAALTGLRKKGHGISSDKVDGLRRYRVSKPQ